MANKVMGRVVCHGEIKKHCTRESEKGGGRSDLNVVTEKNRSDLNFLIKPVTSRDKFKFFYSNSCQIC